MSWFQNVKILQTERNYSKTMTIIKRIILFDIKGLTNYMRESFQDYS